MDEVALTSQRYGLHTWTSGCRKGEGFYKKVTSATKPRCNAVFSAGKSYARARKHVRKWTVRTECQHSALGFLRLQDIAKCQVPQVTGQNFVVHPDSAVPL